MNRNPVNVLNDRMSKASEIATTAIRLTIEISRSNKLQKIDLRKYRGRPEKKEQIRRMISITQRRMFSFIFNGLITESQPIQTKSFEPGYAIVSESEKIIITPNESRINASAKFNLTLKD